MSLYRGSGYSAAKARLCRSMGAHGWDGDTCSTCGIVKDDFATPYVTRGVSIGSPLRGATVGRMEPPRIPELHGNKSLGPTDPGLFRRNLMSPRREPPSA